MSDNRTAMMAAVAGGYLLGRTKKAKLAFAVGSYFMGRRSGPSPARLLSQGLGGLGRAPQIQELTDRVRGELLTATRSAFTSAANRGLAGLADSLRERTDALTGDAPDEDAYFDDEDRETDRETDREPAPSPAPASSPPPLRRTSKKAPPRRTAAPAVKAVPARTAAGSNGRHGGGH